MRGDGSGRFRDRADAGRRLGEALRERGVEADLVLAIPRGGLPLGRAVADALEAPLDVIVASKVGAPGNPEFAIGAVAADGSRWLDAETIERFDIDADYVEREAEREARAAREKAETYRGGRDALDLANRRVVIVDDGVATGATATAAVRLARERGAARVVLAVPVGAPGTVEELSGVADEVVCLVTPPHFGAVGQFYRRFDQVSDEEAMALLDGDR